jgi:K+-sensing histidine kinase KdpD
MGEDFNALSIDDNILEEWQRIVDILAKMANVPVALIMRVDKGYIEVFRASATEGNPYSVGDKEHLENSGLYCETVIKTQKHLLVPNALKDNDWKNNPDIKFNMISYLGYPICYPDKKPFGTLCILDNKENAYNETINACMQSFSKVQETDLALILKNIQLEESERKLKEANTTKNKIFSLIAHDLKNSLGNYASMLAMTMEAKGERHQKLLNYLLNDSENMYELFRNLIDWSREQSSLIKVKLKKTSLEKSMEKALKLYRHSISDKSINIANEIEEDIFVCADKDLLETILRNLITNALKYTQKNGTVILQAKRKDGHIQISVSDTGIGMTEEQKSKIFKGKTVDSVNGTQNEVGTGLGLYLCQEFVKIQGGDICVESEPGKGSTFTFSLAEWQD